MGSTYMQVINFVAGGRTMHCAMLSCCLTQCANETGTWRVQ